LKVKLDENLPARLLSTLRALGHDVDSVPAEHLAGHDDADVWAAAQRDGRFLITQDLDFSDARRFAPDSHHGLLLMRLRRPGREALFDRVHSLFTTEPVETWARCLVVASDHKVRVTRPR
jgi:Domain of unknown function (DUF5615)